MFYSVNTNNSCIKQGAAGEWWSDWSGRPPTTVGKNPALICWQSFSFCVCMCTPIFWQYIIYCRDVSSVWRCVCVVLQRCPIFWQYILSRCLIFWCLTMCVLNVLQRCPIFWQCILSRCLIFWQSVNVCVCVCACVCFFNVLQRCVLHIFAVFVFTNSFVNECNFPHTHADWTKRLTWMLHRSQLIHVDHRSSFYVNNSSSICIKNTQWKSPSHLHCKLTENLL